MSYVTMSELSLMLGNYATLSAMSMELQGYATMSTLSLDLANYALESALDAYLEKSANLSDVNSQQTSLNNVTDVSAATNEYVLTKDTSTGNAIFKPGTVFDTAAGNMQMDGTASAGNSGLTPHSNHVHPTDTSRQATITGGATSITGDNLAVDRALVSDGSGKVAVSGVTSTELGYLSGVTSNVQQQIGESSRFKYGLYTLTPSQTSNLAVGNHVQFNTKVSGSLNAPSTGIGQQNGIITLAGGKTYKIQFDARIATSGGSRSMAFSVYDRTNSVTYPYCTKMGLTSTTASSDNSFMVILSPTTDIDIEIRIIDCNGGSIINEAVTWLLIEEYGGY